MLTANAFVPLYSISFFLSLENSIKAFFDTRKQTGKFKVLSKLPLLSAILMLGNHAVTKHMRFFRVVGLPYL